MDAPKIAAVSCVGCLVLALAFDLALAWLVMVVLAAFGVHIAYLVCLAIVVLLGVVGVML